jgi:hypothetical protein
MKLAGLLLRLLPLALNCFIMHFTLLTCSLLSCCPPSKLICFLIPALHCCRLGINTLDYSPTKAAGGGKAEVQHEAEARRGDAEQLEETVHALERSQKRLRFEAEGGAEGAAAGEMEARAVKRKEAASKLPGPPKTASTASPTKEPLHHRPDFSFPTVTWGKGSVVNDMVSRYALPAIPSGYNVGLNDEIILVSVPGKSNGASAYLATNRPCSSLSPIRVSEAAPAPITDCHQFGTCSGRPEGMSWRTDLKRHKGSINFTAWLLFDFVLHQIVISSTVLSDSEVAPVVVAQHHQLGN